MKKLIPFFLLLIITILAFTSCNSGNRAGKTSDPPNIIFFIADDMYPHHFNCLPEGEGKNLTPNLDRLADEGVLMVNQTVVSPVCTPSRFNCLSGQFASRAVNREFLRKTEKEEGMTCIQWNSFLTENDRIISHYLKDGGYRTGFVGKNHAIDARGFKQIPDYYASAADPEIAGLVAHNYEVARRAILDMGFDYADAIFNNNPRFLGLYDLAVQNTDWIAEKGIEFISQESDKPFFLYFATTVPHGPTDPEHSYEADPRMTAKGIIEKAPDVLPARYTLEERIKEAGLEGTGRENILWLDDAIGALLDQLEASGELENTIIFFFNDHGQRAKGTVYQHGVLNPGIIWKKGGFEVGDVCDQTVSNVDFVPTILDMAGVEYEPDAFDGRSFIAALAGEEMDEPGTQYYELGFARGVRKGKYKYIAVRYPGYALNWTAAQRDSVLDAYNIPRLEKSMDICNEDPTLPFSHLMLIPGGGTAEHQSYGKYPGYFDPDQLYDLEKDPDEQVNLAGDPEYKEVLEDMKNELQKYVEMLPGKFEI
ncbi:MAG: sulfatase-like hydrolase/transferase [Bacteroidales bacterium]|nr:sulfatase-like hydrolase/transferase [Bacteroidales bacterium]